MSYDIRCYQLADTFLSDEPKLNDEGYRRALAQAIQTTIEDFIIGALTEQTYGAEDGDD